MEEVLNSIIMLVISAIVSGVIGTIIKSAVEKKLNKHLKEQQELIELKAAKERQERKEDVLSTFRDEFKPIDEKIDKLSKNISIEIKGTTTLLRESMKKNRDLFVSRGYASATDVAVWHEIYNTYVELGGNHFKEYVDAWKEDVENLPREKNN